MPLQWQKAGRAPHRGVFTLWCGESFNWMRACMSNTFDLDPLDTAVCQDTKKHTRIARPNHEGFPSREDMFASPLSGYSVPQRKEAVLLGGGLQRWYMERPAQSQWKFRASNSNWSLCQGLISSITAGFWCLDPPCHLVKTSANMGWSPKLQQTTVIVAFSGILSVITFFTHLMGDSTWCVTEALTCLLALTSSACLLFSCLRCSCSWPLEIQVPHGGTMWHVAHTRGSLAKRWRSAPDPAEHCSYFLERLRRLGYNYNLFIYIYIYMHDYGRQYWQ